MKNLHRNSKYLVIIFGIGTLIMLVLEFNNRVSDLRHLSVEAEQVSTQVSALKQTQMNLETQIAYATSDAAVEEWAYSEARWIRDGDHPVVPLSPQESTPAPVPELAPTQQVVENWQVWKALFFDQQR
ncbi:MAG: hypothetical protein ABIG63_14710 [Chloroflexota bacterium]